MTDETNPLLTTSGAARILKKSPDRVRDLESCGRLRALRTENGQRIFRLEDVVALAREMECQK